MRRESALFAVLLGVTACSSNNASSGPVDASTVDASAQDAAAGGVDASDAGAPDDAGNPEDAGDSDAGEDGGPLSCSMSVAAACAIAPVGYECPPSLESELPGTWCASHSGAGAILGACAGYTVLPETFVGTELLYMYALDGGALAAVVNLTGGKLSCAGGDPDFSMPLTCFGTPLSATFDGAGAATGCALDAGAGDAGDAGASDAGDAGDGGT